MYNVCCSLLFFFFLFKTFVARNFYNNRVTTVIFNIVNAAAVTCSIWKSLKLMRGVEGKRDSADASITWKRKGRTQQRRPFRGNRSYEETVVSLILTTRCRGAACPTELSRSVSLQASRRLCRQGTRASYISRHRRHVVRRSRAIYSGGVSRTCSRDQREQKRMEKMDTDEDRGGKKEQSSRRLN